MQKTVEDVKNFWDRHPLWEGETSLETGTREWFERMGRTKLEDCFCGDLSGWIPAEIRGKKVLDLGCGPGFWMKPVTDAGALYYGIDISPRAVELALAWRGILKIDAEVLCGNAEEIPFSGNYFDYVISEGVIHHTPGTQTCVDEIRRVLKPGGLAAAGVYYKGFPLRAPFFKPALALMRISGSGLKGRGRERMLSARSPEELVRMYDGAENPVGKSYSVPELRRMFSAFSDLRFSRYYFPSRALPVRLPRALHRFLHSHAGFMIQVRAVKA